MLLDEFNEIARELEVHHGLFQKFWELGRPVFTDKVEVADVSYDKVGRTINFKINPDAWGKMTREQKTFTIAHQCLHILLYHGFRISNLNKEQKKLADKALDIVANHSLVNNFGFNRESVDPDNEMCWIDKVFPDGDVADNRSFEYYYTKIKEQQEQDGEGEGEGESKGQKGKGKSAPGSGEPQDGEESEGQGETEHSGLESFCDGEFEKFMKEEVAESVGKEEAEGMQEIVEKHTEDIKEQVAQQAGAAPGSAFKKIKPLVVPKKNKWETVIKKWLRKTWNDTDADQWSRRSRRMATVSADLFLPTEMDTEESEKARLSLWFFLDTSGSCAHLADRFFKAALSVPLEKFDMKLFCFDTKVYEVSLKDKKLFGFGGTSFICIENYIQQRAAKEGISPNAIFLITDGYGDHVKPEHPGKWNWFLSENYKECIPKESQVFMLKDFE